MNVGNQTYPNAKVLWAACDYSKGQLNFALLCNLLWQMTQKKALANQLKPFVY